MIQGVKVKQLKPFCDERGRLTELFRSDWPEFIKFGQLYLTTAFPQAVKAWHYHKIQTDTFVCVAGMMKLVLCDKRDNSPTKGEINEFFIGVNNPLLVQIPPLVHHGFKCISETEAMILNVPTETYKYDKPDEYRLPYDSPEIPYNWERKNG
jgi:dTDP-4-dehydrorhamnose 3,5-epimerase